MINLSIGVIIMFFTFRCMISIMAGHPTVIIYSYVTRVCLVFRVWCFFRYGCTVNNDQPICLSLLLLSFVYLLCYRSSALMISSWIRFLCCLIFLVCCLPITFCTQQRRSNQKCCFSHDWAGLTRFANGISFSNF